LIVHTFHVPLETIPEGIPPDFQIGSKSTETRIAKNKTRYFCPLLCDVRPGRQLGCTALLLTGCVPSPKWNISQTTLNPLVGEVVDDDIEREVQQFVDTRLLSKIPSKT
jgi:hypothetical protein